MQIQGPDLEVCDSTAFYIGMLRVIAAQIRRENMSSTAQGPFEEQPHTHSHHAADLERLGFFLPVDFHVNRSARSVLSVSASFWPIPCP